MTRPIPAVMFGDRVVEAALCLTHEWSICAPMRREMLSLMVAGNRVIGNIWAMEFAANSSEIAAYGTAVTVEPLQPAAGAGQGLTTSSASASTSAVPFAVAPGTTRR